MPEVRVVGEGIRLNMTYSVMAQVQNPNLYKILQMIREALYKFHILISTARQLW